MPGRKPGGAAVVREAGAQLPPLTSDPGPVPAVLGLRRPSRRQGCGWPFLCTCQPSPSKISLQGCCLAEWRPWTSGLLLPPRDLSVSGC